MQRALYRKINDRTQNSSTYHKKDGTSVRSKLKQQLQKSLNQCRPECTCKTPDITYTGEPFCCECGKPARVEG